MITKRNFRIIAFSLLFAGLGCMIGSLLVNQESTKLILLGITAAFYIAAAIQIVIYKNRPKAFDDKSKNNG